MARVPALEVCIILEKMVQSGANREKRCSGESVEQRAV